MKQYNNEISLVRNSRGVYCIDTTMGCTSGLQNSDGGCYGDCYAAKTAKRYGHDFSKTVLRKFTGEGHKRKILSQISKIKMPFIRIGCSGDPSENWQHTINVLKVLSKSNTEIVIITRHWQTLTDDQLKYLSTINVCINTSISALDKPGLLNHSLIQYNRVKTYCKSILRIVSCDFNLKNEIGKQLYIIQESLFKNEGTLDTVFRPSHKNKFVNDGVINTRKEIFNGKSVLASKRNRKTYMGKCNKCKEMCGQAMATSNNYPNKRSLTTQLPLL